MAYGMLKLTSGQNIRLSTIAFKLATLCGKCLYDGIPVSSENKMIVHKGREYFKFVKAGLKFERNEMRGFSYDPETLHSINSLQEVYLVSADIEEILSNTEKTFNILEGKDEIEGDTIEKSMRFFKDLADKVRRTNYNPESSHVL